MPHSVQHALPHFNTGVQVEVPASSAAQLGDHGWWVIKASFDARITVENTGDTFQNVVLTVDLFDGEQNVGTLMGSVALAQSGQLSTTVSDEPAENRGHKYGHIEPLQNAFPQVRGGEAKWVGL